MPKQIKPIAPGGRLTRPSWFPIVRSVKLLLVVLAPLVVLATIPWLVTESPLSPRAAAEFLEAMGSEVHEGGRNQLILSASDVPIGRSPSGHSISQTARRPSRVAASLTASGLLGLHPPLAPTRRDPTPHPRLRLIRPAP
jgi:hypothetical protein